MNNYYPWRSDLVPYGIRNILNLTQYKGTPWNWDNWKNVSVKVMLSILKSNHFYFATHGEFANDGPDLLDRRRKKKNLLIFYSILCPRFTRRDRYLNTLSTDTNETVINIGMTQSTRWSRNDEMKNITATIMWTVGLMSLQDLIRPNVISILDGSFQSNTTAETKDVCIRRTRNDDRYRSETNTMAILNEISTVLWNITAACMRYIAPIEKL